MNVRIVIIVFLGPPGAGKGTQAIKLCDHFGWKHLSTGDLLRYEVDNGTKLGLLANKFMKKGDLVWVKPLKKQGIIVRIIPPTIRYPVEFVKVQFFDNTPVDDFLKSMLSLVSECQ